MKWSFVGVVLLLIVQFHATRADTINSGIYLGTGNNPNRIQYINKDGTGLTTLRDNGPGDNFLNIVVDSNSQLMYYSTSAGEVYRANLSVEAPQLLSNVGGADLELDIAAGKLYASGGNSIRRHNLDGSGLETVYQTSTGIVGLAIDSLHGRMYFTNTNTNSIQRANLDGSEVETIVSFDVNVDLEDIEVDPVGGKLFWTDGLTDKMQRANLDGTDVEDLIDASSTAFNRKLELDIDAGQIYWSTPGSPRKSRHRIRDFFDFGSTPSAIALPGGHDIKAA
jgi:hypothetical protein